VTLLRFCTAVVGLVTVLACGGDDAAPASTEARFDVAPEAGFWDAPFPSAHRMRDDGSLIVSDFPAPPGNGPVALLLSELESTPIGFGTNAAVFFPFDGPLDPTTVPVADTVVEDGSIVLVDIDADSPELDRSIPIWVAFRDTAQTSSPENLLVLLPRPGISLRPNTLYAAYVTDDVRGAGGEPLGTPETLVGLLDGDGAVSSPALTTGFTAVGAHLDRAAVARDSIRAATVFRTGDPFAEMVRLRDYVSSRPAPAATDLSLLVEHDTYCVIEGDVTVPLFQDGERPFTDAGGGIRFEADGTPILEGEETIRFSLTIPKAAMPADGWPLLFYSAGQGGAYTQVVDRGTFEEQMTDVPGRGPSLYLADVGIATISIEAPLVGPRHPLGDTSGLEFFSPTNAISFRDNARQAAVDFASLTMMAEGLTVPASLCPGADAAGGPHRYDQESFFFHGHSTGATNGAMVLGLEPGIRAGVLSGFGGSWLYNLTIKTAPLVIAEVVKLFLGFIAGDEPDIYDPLLNLLQTFWEPSEPMNWARRWALEPLPGNRPKHIFVLEGVVDGYFRPPSANAAALAGHLAPVEPTVEPTLEEDLALIGLAALAAPAGGNLETTEGPVTAIVAQHLPPDGVDGHFIPFENDPPKYQYRCFFASALGGATPTVPAPNGDPFAACP